MMGNNATATITATMASGAKGAMVDDGIVTATAMTARTVLFMLSNCCQWRC
jgi:hypothetical protein